MPPSTLGFPQRFTLPQVGEDEGYAAELMIEFMYTGRLPQVGGGVHACEGPMGPTPQGIQTRCASFGRQSLLRPRGPAALPGSRRRRFATLGPALTRAPPHPRLALTCVPPHPAPGRAAHGAAAHDTAGRPVPGPVGGAGRRALPLPQCQAPRAKRRGAAAPRCLAGAPTSPTPRPLARALPPPRYSASCLPATPRSTGSLWTASIWGSPCLSSPCRR
jgi:hypothetical protein